MTINHYRQLGVSRPIGFRWSQMLFGRTETQRLIMERGEVVLSAYRVSDGRIFYQPAACEGKPGSKVLYRIRVKLKEKVR